MLRKGKRTIKNQSMTTELKLIETDSEFLEKIANKINVLGDEWFYMPFWFKKTGDNRFVIYTFDKLPDCVKEFIKENRL